MRYNVTWCIDIEANSPEEAARTALEIQRRPDSIATFFTVEDDDGSRIDVDLDLDLDREDDTDDGPQDGDAVVYCDGNRYHAGFQSGPSLGWFNASADAYAALRADCDDTYFPDYWFVSDHGNAWRTDDHGRELK